MSADPLAGVDFGIGDEPGTGTGLAPEAPARQPDFSEAPGLDSSSGADPLAGVDFGELDRSTGNTGAEVPALGASGGAGGEGGSDLAPVAAAGLSPADVAELDALVRASGVRREAPLPMSAQVAATMGPEAAAKALDDAMRLGIPPDVAFRQRETVARRLAEKRIPLAEVAESRALRAFYGDPIRAAAGREHAESFLELRRALSRKPLTEELPRRFELGQGAPRQGDLVYRRMGFGPPLSPEEAAEWDAIKGAREGAAPGAAEERLSHDLLEPEDFEAFETIQGELDRLEPVTELDRALGSAAEQAPLLLSGGAAAATGAVLAGAVPATIAVGATLLGQPEVAGPAAALVAPAAKAGALAFGAESFFRANLGESYAMLEDLRTDAGEPLPHEAQVGAAVAAAAVKTGLDVVSLAALLQVIPGGSALFSGPLSAVRRKVGVALASQPETLRSFAEFGASYLQAIGSEAVTEGLQEIVDRAAADATVSLASGAGLGETAGRVAEGAGEALPEAELASKEAGRATAVFGLFGGGVQVIRSGLRRIVRAESDAQRMARFEAALEKLKPLLETAPDAAREVIQAVGDEQGQGEVYMTAQDLARAGGPELFEALSPATREEVRAAVAEGRPAAIPVGEYALAMSKRPPREAEATGGAAPSAAPAARLAPDSLTPEEAEAERKDLRAAAEQAEQAVDPERQAARAADARAYGKRAHDALLAAGRPFEEAAEAAVVIEQALLAHATRRGQDVATSLEQLPRLSFVGPRIVGLERPDLADAPVRDLARARKRNELLAAVADLRNESAPESRAPAEAYPVLDLLRRLGGVERGSALAGELRNMGVTPRTMRGLFRIGRDKYGREPMGAADQLIRSENPLLAHLPVTEGTDYLDERAILDAIRAEVAGQPIEREEVALRRAETERVREELREALEAAGVDLATATDSEAVEALISAEAEAIDALFQPRMPEPPPNLIALHNIQPGQVLEAEELGGMPMPSVAIREKTLGPSRQFGPITLVGSRELIEPGRWGAPRVFSRDVYSPTVPGKEWKLAKNGRTFDEKILPLAPFFGEINERSAAQEAEEAAKKGPDRLLSWASRSDAMQYAYLRSHGVDIEIPQRDMAKAWAREAPGADSPEFLAAAGPLLRQHVEAGSSEHRTISDAYRAALSRWAESAATEEAAPELRESLLRSWADEFFDEETGLVYYGRLLRLERVARAEGVVEADPFALRPLLEREIMPRRDEYERWLKDTFAGSWEEPRITVGRRKLPYTLENVLAAMGRQRLVAAGEGLTFGPGEAATGAARELKTLRGVRRAGALTMDEQAVDRWKEESLKPKLDAYLALAPDQYEWRSSWDAFDDSMKAIFGYLKRRDRSESALRREMIARGFRNPSNEFLERGMALARSLEAAPTAWLEAKFQRAVQLSEFSGAVIPADTSADVRGALERAGLEVREYAAGDHSDRALKLALFWERPDVLFQPAYHGTRVKQLEGGKFSLSKIGTGEGAQAYGWGLYFTSKKEIAEFYRKSLSSGYDALLLDGEERPDLIPLQTRLLERARSIRRLASLNAMDERSRGIGWKAEHERDEAIISEVDAETETLAEASVANLIAHFYRQHEAAVTADPARFDSALRVSAEAARAELERQIRVADADIADRARVRSGVEETHVGKTRADTLRRLDEADDDTRTRQAAYAAEIAALERVLPRLSHRAPGQVFKVEVPEPDELMDWDKPLLDQPQILEKLERVDFGSQRNAAANLRIAVDLRRRRDALVGAPVTEESQAEADRINAAAANLSDVEVKAAEGTGEDFYSLITSYATEENAEKFASESLAAAGIKGHSYIGHESGERNYVIYDPEAIQVVETYYQQKERIVGVAMRRPDGELVMGQPGQVHAELVPELDLDDDDAAASYERLFVTSLGRVVDPEEAQRIAVASEQTNRPAAKGLHTSSLRATRNAGPPEDPRGSITFSAGMRDAVVAFTRPDASTAIHELGHYYTLSLIDEARAEDAPAWVKRDAAVLARYGGAEEGSLDFSEEGKEKLAEAFVAYLHTGKAPSAELRSVFARFRVWLSRLYASVREYLGEDQIPAEVREVFDRMLATDAQIAALREEESGGSIFSSLDLSAEEREAIEEAMAASAGIVRSELDRLQLVELAKRRGIFEKVAAERARIRAEEEARVRAEVAAEVEREQVWRADHYLRTGQLLGMATPEGLPAQKISRPAIVELFGAESEAGKAILAVPTGARSWLSVTKGVHPDEIAEQLGYDTGADLVRALLAAGSREAGSRQRVIEERTKARMRALEAAVPPGELEAAALRAFRSDARMVFLETEERVLAARTGNAVAQGLQERARYIVSQREVRDLRPDRARLFARKARRDAMAAVRRGDWTRAQVLLRRERLQEFVEAESMAAQERVEAIVARARRFERDPKARKEIGLAGHGYLAQMDGVLELVELRVLPIAEAQRRRESFFEWLTEREAQGDEIVVPDWMRQRGQRHWRTLSVVEIEGLGAVLESIANAAKQQRVMLLGDELVERETVRAGIEAELEAGVLRKPTRSARASPHRATLRSALEALGAWDREKVGDELWSGFRRIDALLVGKEAMLTSIVASDPTTWTFKALVQPFVDAARYKADLMTRWMTPVKERADAYMRRHGRKYDEIVDEHRLSFEGRPMQFSRRDLLGVALHFGSRSSAEKLMGGFGWWDGEDSTFDAAHGLVQDVLETHLSDEDWALVQWVWDSLEGLRPLVWALEKKMTGLEPVAVEPESFTLASGRVMRGGYFPIVYDPTRAGGERTAQLEEERRAKERPGGFGPIETRHPWTKARTKLKSRPVKIDAFGILMEHLEDVAHDLAFREPILSTYRLLNDDGLVRSLRGALGPEFGLAEFWMPWLKAMGRDVAEPGLAGLNKPLRGMRMRASAFVMLARPTTILVQPTGVFNGLQGLAEQVTGHRVGTGARHVVAFRYLADAYWQVGRRFSSDADRLRAWAMAESGVLRHRMETYDRDLRDLARKLEGRHGWDDETIQFFRHLIAGTQLYAVDLPVWVASYRLGMDQGLAHADAVAGADSTVRTSQGSGEPVSLSKIMLEGGEAGKLLTWLGTYLHTVLGQIRGSWRRHHSVPATAAAIATSLVYPTLLAFAIRQAWNAVTNALFPGAAPEPPEDDEWLERAAKEVGTSALNLFPLVREFSRTIVEGRDAGLPGYFRVWGDVAADLRRGAEAAYRDDDYDRLLLGIMKALGLGYGLPAGWLLDAAERAEREDRQATGGSRRRAGRARTRREGVRR